jgi:CRP-like cAMP-binding protein
MTGGRIFEYSVSELAGHASFILVAASYAVDDFLMLRMIAVAGSTSMLVFTFFHPHGRVLWLPFRWNLLFILINSYRIGRVMFDKYEVRRLQPEELKLHHAHFQVMDLTDFSKLFRLGTIESFGDGEVVLTQGQMNPDIRLVIFGELDVFRDGVYTYSLGEGNFMSEAGLHIGMRLKGEVECSGNVLSKGRCQCIRWNRTELIELLDQEKDLKRSFLSALSWDIIEKLKGQRHLLMSGKVSSPDQWTEKRNAQSDYRYAGILKNILSRPGGLSLRCKDEIDNYRAIHHIDDKHHEWALKFCGWSLEEFQSGIKKAQAEAGLADDYNSSESISWLSFV